jgi:uncharacterized damage-inducible protein DinB
MPGWLTNAIRTPELNLSGFGGYTLESTETLLSEFDRVVREAREAIGAANDADFRLPWSLKFGDQVIFTATRGTVVRQTINHIVHHRGQLTVYLRLLDVPVPKIYGPTADER